METFNKVFNTINTRVPLMALLDAKEREIISASFFKKAILYMENFHFAYTAVLSRPTNRVDSLYSSFAIKLRNSINKTNSHAIVGELLRTLNSLFPTFVDFCSKFILLNYSKGDNPSNMKTKYAINKLNCYYSGSDLFDEKGSIEHILPESSDVSLYIGNLILLENTLNREADNKNFSEKIPIYNKSSYPWIEIFTEEHDVWKENDIHARAEAIARIYYERIIGKQIEL